MGDFLFGLGVCAAASLALVAVSIKLFGREPTMSVLGNFADMLYRGLRVFSARLDSAAQAFFLAEDSPWRERMDGLEDRVRVLEMGDDEMGDTLTEIQRMLDSLSFDMDVLQRERDLEAEQAPRRRIVPVPTAPTAEE